MRKVYVLLVMVVLFSMVFTSCASQKTTTKGVTDATTTKGVTDATTTKGVTDATTTTTNVITIKDYKPKTNKLTIQTTNRNVPEGNLNQKWLEEYMGVEMEFLIIPSADEQATKINLLASTASLPDVMALNNVSLYYSLIKQGLLVDIEDMLPIYAPNVYESRTDEWLEYMRYVDGNIYALNNYDIVDNEILLTRKDWVEKLGLKMPTTTDEFYNMVDRFVHGDPNGNGKDDTYGYFASGSRLIKNFSTIWAAFGANPEQWIWKGNEIVYGPIQKEMKDAVKYLQKMYSNGLIAKDYITLTNDNRNEGLYAGTLGLVSGAFNYCDAYWAEWHADETAVWTGTMGINGPGGSGYLSNGHPYKAHTYCVISTDSKDPALGLLYINLLATEEGFMRITKGIEGTHYKMVNGKMEFLEPFKSDNTLLYNNGITYTYTMPFLWRSYPPATVEAASLELLYKRQELEVPFYGAMPLPVPEIVDRKLDAGMWDYVSKTIHELIMGEGNVDTVLDEMSAMLYARYNLKEQEQYVRAYAEELGFSNK